MSAAVKILDRFYQQLLPCVWVDFAVCGQNPDAALWTDPFSIVPSEPLSPRTYADRIDGICHIVGECALYVCRSTSLLTTPPPAAQ